jgi:hypothetical protein
MTSGRAYAHRAAATRPGGPASTVRPSSGSAGGLR